MHQDSVRIIFNAGIWQITACVLLAAAAALLYLHTWPPVSRERRVLLASLRAASFILLILFISNPACVTTRIYERRPFIPVLIDVSRSMLARDCGGRTRIEAAWETAGMIAGRFDDSEMRIIPFASGIEPALEANGSAPVADKDGTDIHAAVRDAFREFQSENLQALVILSDGRVTSGMTGDAGDFRAPVYTIGFGDTSEGADLAVEEIYCERTAYRGAVHEIKAVIRIEGKVPGPAEVRLIEGNTVVDSIGIRTTGAQGEVEIGLRYVPRAEGEHLLELSVSSFEGEKAALNNSMQVRIMVLKDKLRILYLDQYADWNMTFIRNIARRSQRLDIDQVIWTPSGGYRLAAGGDEWSFPGDHSGLDGYDMVIIGDYENTETKPQLGALEKFVRDGGSLLFIGCEKSPLLDAGAVGMMEGFLPVAVRRAPSVTAGEYYAQWSVGSRETPLAASLSGSQLIDAIPPLPAVIGGFEEKPGAERIMALRDGEQTFPMLALQRYGDGLSGVVLGFPIWRWKLAGEKGDEFYTSLISGLIEYMSEGFDAGELVVYPGRTVYRTGEPVGVTAFFKSGSDVRRVMGEISGGTGAPENFIRKFGFYSERGYLDIFRARLDPLPPGEYTITASGEGPSGEVVTGSASMKVEKVSVEFMRTAGDRRFLQRLAARSGGRSLEAGEAGALHGLIERRSDTSERIDTRNLRGEILLFIGIIISLSAEWILRKIWGLV